MTSHHKPLSVVAVLTCGLMLTACQKQSNNPPKGRIVIAAPVISQGSSASFQRDLIQLFAQESKLEITIQPTPEHLMTTALQRHQVHIAAAPFRITNYAQSIRYAPSYQTSKEVVVCHQNASTNEAHPKLELSALTDSSQELLLKELHTNNAVFSWSSRIDMSHQDLLTEVALELQDCTIVNESQFNEALVFHPNLRKRETLGESQLAWALPANAPKGLIQQVNDFFNKIKKDGRLNQLFARYYEIHDHLSTLDIEVFKERALTLLPQYQEHFITAAKQTNEDWRLIAALAYQESHWDPLATSFSNVRGMMMLTEATAKSLGVKNRLNTRESILAGAKYFANIKRQLPKQIKEPDRTWFALAAYNQGIGSILDARVLTQQAKLNPNLWLDLKQKMPLLSQPEYLDHLKHGPARGGEAVILTENIRTFYEILKRINPSNTSTKDFYSATNLSNPPK